MKDEGKTIDPRRVNRLSEASEWLLRLQAPQRTEADYEEWLRWCDADPENFAAFETLQRRWNELDALKSSFILAPGPAQTSTMPDRQVARPRRWVLAAALATLAIAVGMVQYLRHGAAAPVQEIAATYASRTATLPDGSKMILGAQSRVNMDFDGTKRQVDLSSGEAYFDVMHDKARPFIVHAGQVSVTALGTAFDVRRYRDKVTVTVEEGAVEVRGETRDERDAVWRAAAGHQLVYSIRDRTASLASVDPATALSWRNGELAYIHEPLATVVEDLNRYSPRKIRIVDPQVAAIPFTGTAFAASLDGWLAGLQQAYPVEVSESPAGEIILSSRGQSPDAR